MAFFSFPAGIAFWLCACLAVLQYQLGHVCNCRVAREGAVV